MLNRLLKVARNSDDLPLGTAPVTDIDIEDRDDDAAIPVSACRAPASVAGKTLAVT